MHHLWSVDGNYVHIAGGAADFKARNPKDDQFYRIVDVRRPSQPTEVGRWWLPGTRDGDAEPAPVAPRGFDSGFRAHNTNVYPQRPDRAWVGYLDGGAVILDISDMAHPRLVSRWDYHPPFPGFTHTVLPLLGRGLMIVSDEAVRDGGRGLAQARLDRRRARRDQPGADRDVPAAARRRVQGARGPLRRPQPAREPAGAGGLESRRRSSSAPSSTAACAPSTCPTPSSPKEVAYHVPAAPRGSRAGAIQINDVFVDERGIVYAVDRFMGGLYVLEMTV